METSSNWIGPAIWLSGRRSWGSAGCLLLPGTQWEGTFVGQAECPIVPTHSDLARACPISSHSPTLLVEPVLSRCLAAPGTHNFGARCLLPRTRGNPGWSICSFHLLSSWGGIILCCRAEMCTMGDLAVFFAFTHKTPARSSPECDNQKCSRHFQMSPGEQNQPLPPPVIWESLV